MYKLCGEEPETLVPLATLGIRRRSSVGSNASSDSPNTLSTRNNDPKTKTKATPKTSTGKQTIPKPRVSCNQTTKKCSPNTRHAEDKCPKYRTQIFDPTTKTCKDIPAQILAIKPVKPSAEYTKMKQCLATKGADMFYIPTFLGKNTRIGTKLPKTIVPGTCVKDPSATAGPAPQVKNPGNTTTPPPGEGNPGTKRPTTPPPGTKRPTTPPPGNKKPTTPVRKPSLKGKGPVPQKK